MDWVDEWMMSTYELCMQACFSMLYCSVGMRARMDLWITAGRMCLMDL